MLKEHGEGVTRLNVAQHEERDEDEPQPHQDRKPDAVPARLQGKTTSFQSFHADRQKKVALLDRKLLLCCVQEHFLWLTGYHLNQH